MGQPNAQAHRATRGCGSRASPITRRPLAYASFHWFGSLLVEVVERVAPRHEPVARRGGAVAEGAADLAGGSGAPGEHVGGQVGVGEHHATQTRPSTRPAATMAWATGGSHSWR